MFKAICAEVVNMGECWTLYIHLQKFNDNEYTKVNAGNFDNKIAAINEAEEYWSVSYDNIIVSNHI